MNTDEPSPKELDIGEPAPLDAAQDIATIEQRIAYLADLRARLLKSPLGLTNPVKFDEQLKSCDDDLTKARNLLAKLRLK